MTDVPQMRARDRGSFSPCESKDLVVLFPPPKVVQKSERWNLHNNFAADHVNILWVSFNWDFFVSLTGKVLS